MTALVFIGGWIIADPNIPDAIADVCIASPVVVGVVAWRLAYGKWAWRIDRERSDSRRLRNHRLICIFSAIGFVLLHFVVSGTMRAINVYHLQRGTLDRTESEAKRIADEVLNYARSHQGRYPETLAQIPREHQVWGWWSGSDGIHHPNMEGLDDKTIADEGQFAYFGNGLSTESPSDVVVIESRKELLGGAHVLATVGSDTFWIGPKGFLSVQHFLEQHIPRSEWKD